MDLTVIANHANIDNVVTDNCVISGCDMSVADKTIEPKILESAKAEFLSKPYEDVSLREICSKAGVTTGALYKRFTNKEALFDALVAPTLKWLRICVIIQKALIMTSWTKWI